MDEDVVVRKAMTVPGATFPVEVWHLYHLALQAPLGSQFVELGTYQGRTLVALAYAALLRSANVLSVDNYRYDEPGSKPSSLNQVQTNLAGLGFVDGKEPSIRLFEGDTRTVPSGVGDIGLLFVDSTHTRAHFDAEMAAWLPHVVQGGIVACHDYDSPRWTEMTGAIQAWFEHKGYECLGCGRRLIGYRRLA